MAREDQDIPPQVQQLVTNRAQQQRALEGGGGVADLPGGERVTGEGQLVVQVAHRVVGVPRRLQYPELESCHAQLPAFLNRPGRESGLGGVLAVDRRVVDLLNGGDAVDVAPVDVGEQDMAQVQVVVLDQGQEAGVKDPCVDEHGVSRPVRTDQVAVGETDDRKVCEQPHRGSCSEEKKASSVFE